MAAAILNKIEKSPNFSAMTYLRWLGILLRKELLLEWRQKYALGGMLLYVASTIFVVHLIFADVDPRSWNALFWIIVMFGTTNAVAKSFIQENSKRQLYYYALAPASVIILAKIIYNIILLTGLMGITYAGFVFVAGNPVKETLLFFLSILLGSVGFSICFTFLSAIAAKAKNSSTLLAILSFPVVLPILMTLTKLSAESMQLIQDSQYWRDIFILFSIDTLLITLVFFLFPYLWRD